MFEEIYIWLESYSGTSYDFDESIREISSDDAFNQPFDWSVGIDLILKQLDDACDVIDQYWRAIPTDLPDKNTMKKMLSRKTLEGLVANIRSVCGKLNIDAVRIDSVDQLKFIVVTLSELIDMLINHDPEEIMAKGLFDQHEEDNNESFYRLLNVMKEDVPQLSFNVRAIRDSYLDSLNNEEDLF
jgi:hypothetical protein